MPFLERYKSQTLTKKAGLSISMVSPFHFFRQLADRSFISILQVLRTEWRINRIYFMMTTRNGKMEIQKCLSFSAPIV